MKKEHDLHRREARKTGGGKAPASPSEVSKLLADVIPASVNPLEQEFDDDAGEELDLRWPKTRWKLLHAKWGQVHLLSVKLVARKEPQKSQKRRIARTTIIMIFNRF